jgi:hypothetical protein
MDTKKPKCFSCGRTDGEVPLLHLTYDGSDLKICPQCLPTLIHQIERLIDKLPVRR